jgi:Type IV secretion system proteins
MTRRKRILLAGVCGLVLLGADARPAGAAIPVIDTAALIQWAQQLAYEARQLAIQAQQYILEETAGIRQAAQYATQLQQYAQEVQLFLNFAHAPLAGLTTLMNQLGVGNSLPLNPQSMINLVEGFRYGSGGFGQLTGLLGQLGGLAGYAYQQNHLYTPTDGSFQSQQVMDRGNSIAGAQGAMAAAYADNRTHEAALQTLRTQLEGADTTKDTLDASGQVQTEIAWNVNQLGQMQAIAVTADLQRDNLMQRDNERLACELESFRGGGAACSPGIAPAPAAGP